MKEGVDCEQSEQDGVIVIFFMATGVALHNYLPLLTQGTPCFARACALCGTPDDLTKSNLLVVIKKETARRAMVLLSAMPTHQLHSAL